MKNLLIVAAGFSLMIVILKYRRPIKDFVGDIAFAEKYLGSGGTNTLIVLIGIAVFFLSLMWALGTLQGILDGLLGSFF